MKIEAIQWMLSNAAKGHDLRSSRQLLKVSSLRPHEANTDTKAAVEWGPSRVQLHTAVIVDPEPVSGQ